MSTPTPTLTGAYTCTHHNDRERAACPVCLVAAITAERDQLLRDYKYDHKCLHEVRERCESWKQRAERAEAELDGIRALAGRRNKRYHVEDTTHQLVAALDQALDIAQAELATEREKVTMLLSDAYALTKNWHDRAERAEAELAKYLSACPASPTEEERKRCQQWWAISGRSP